MVLILASKNRWIRVKACSSLTLCELGVLVTKSNECRNDCVIFWVVYIGGSSSGVAVHTAAVASWWFDERTLLLQALVGITFAWSYYDCLAWIYLGCLKRKGLGPRGIDCVVSSRILVFIAYWLLWWHCGRILLRARFWNQIGVSWKLLLACAYLILRLQLIYLSYEKIDRCVSVWLLYYFVGSCLTQICLGFGACLDCWGILDWCILANAAVVDYMLVVGDRTRLLHLHWAFPNSDACYFKMGFVYAKPRCVVIGLCLICICNCTACWCRSCGKLLLRLAIVSRSLIIALVGSCVNTQVLFENYLCVNCIHTAITVL